LTQKNLWGEVIRKKKGSKGVKKVKGRGERLRDPDRPKSSEHGNFPGTMMTERREVRSLTKGGSLSKKCVGRKVYPREG